MSAQPSNEKPISESLGASSEYAKALLQTKVDQIKLDAVEKGTKATSSLLIFLFTGLGICGTLFFSLYALALYLGELMGSTPLGFLLVAAFTLLLCFLFYAFRHRVITNPVLRRLAKTIYESPTKNHE